MAEEKLSQIVICSFPKYSLDAFYVNYWEYKHE